MINNINVNLHYPFNNNTLFIYMQVPFRIENIIIANYEN